MVDNELLWHKQVSAVTQKVACKMALLRRLKSFLDANILYVYVSQWYSHILIIVLAVS